MVRFGVAPDHPEVKLVENKFGELARDPRVGFIGNVQVNKDLCTDCCMTWLTCIALTELQQHYDAVISCSGAQGDRTLGIKGESLDRVYSASTATFDNVTPTECIAGEFVAWYNGLPGVEKTDFDLHTPRRAAILGALHFPQKTILHLQERRN